MEQFPIRYPQTEHRRYTPGSKGLNKHYKAHRVQFFGQKGIIKTEFRTIHRNPSVGLYTDQRGIPSFAYKIPNGKIYKTAPQMDKLPRGGNVPRVVGTLGDVFQDVVDQGTPGAISGLRNGGGPNTPPSTMTPPSTSTDAIQGSQALGSNLSLVGSSTDVYQTAPESLVESRTNVYRAPSESDHDMNYSPAVIITNPADEKTSRLPGVHQETIDYADGDAQPGYVEHKRTFAKSKEELRKMSNAENAVTSSKSDAMSIDNISPKSDSMSIDKNEFNPLQNADRIVPSTETFITFPGPPRFAYGPAVRRRFHPYHDVLTPRRGGVSKRRPMKKITKRKIKYNREGIMRS